MLITSHHTIEEALRTIEERAAMLRFFADSTRQIDVVPEPAFFSGLGDTLGEIQTIAHAVRRALDANALSTEIGSDQHRRRGGRQS